MERLFTRLLSAVASIARRSIPDSDGSNRCSHRAERIYPNGTPACAIDLA
jgi:hypothetical protein